MSAVVGVTPNIRLIVLEKWAKSEKLPARAASVRSAPSDSALFALRAYSTLPRWRLVHLFVLSLMFEYVSATSPSV